MHHLTALRRAVRAATPALALGTAALTAALAACSDNPTAPVTPAAQRAPAVHATSSTTSTTSAATVVAGLTRTTPLTDAITASGTIDQYGGEISIPAAGVTLHVDSFTVAVPTQFTVTALPGQLLAYEFTPHGAFPTGGIKIKQALAGTSAEGWAASGSKKQQLYALAGAYFLQASDLSESSATATVQEFQPLAVDLKKNSIEFKVTHFSGWLVSWGRE